MRAHFHLVLFSFYISLSGIKTYLYCHFLDDHEIETKMTLAVPSHYNFIFISKNINFIYHNCSRTCKYSDH